MSIPFPSKERPVRLRRTGAPSPLLAVDRRIPRDTEPIDVDTRIFVWQRDEGRCRNCGSKKDLQFDHVIPRSWGGASTVENVQLLCGSCNLKKGASLIDGGPRVCG